MLLGSEQLRVILLGSRDGSIGRQIWTDNANIFTCTSISYVYFLQISLSVFGFIYCTVSSLDSILRIEHVIILAGHNSA